MIYMSKSEKEDNYAKYNIVKYMQNSAKSR